MIQPSTFSIVACDLQARAWGVAVASKFPAVGAVVPSAQAEIGAVATQAFSNTSFGPRGLALMASGLSAPETLARLLEEDTSRETRQLGLVDARGKAVSYTGEKCFNWAGGLSGPGYAIQGNILAGEAVVQAMQQAFLETRGDLPARMYAALVAGDRAGGDRRGRQSAALVAVKPRGGYGGYLDRWMDYRIDDHPNPVPELGKLIELHHLYFSQSPEAERVKLEGEPLRQLQAVMARLGYYQGELHGRYDPASMAAVRAFTGNENFEDRCSPEAGWIDPPVLAYLLEKFAG